MNNKTVGILVGGALVLGGAGGAILVDNTVAVQSATFEKIDATTLQITQPVSVDIKSVKEEVNNLQGRKQLIQQKCDLDIADTQAQIDVKKSLISEAKKIGVE